MNSSFDAGDIEITPEALRALADWTRTFSGKLRQSVARLASEDDSRLPVTMDMVHRAVVMASEQTAAAVSPSSEECKGDGTERHAA